MCGLSRFRTRRIRHRYGGELISRKPTTKPDRAGMPSAPAAGYATIMLPFFAALGDRRSRATATFFDTLVLPYTAAAHKQKDAYKFPAEYSPVQMPIASGDPMIRACEVDVRRAGGKVCGATRIGPPGANPAENLI
ncbi:hypothetical protein EDB92DRAFT_1818215 [Lactarius akahatsu]|uniref:Uncharacterized protein n=1 Tax=Lactarius akahatsu TaxID=416441 RepID=A0AAD4Q5U2_9AGAM|nr:hypothetical protein EDB92DRAFT_1818215 [Lactarius akahatsu]